MEPLVISGSTENPNVTFNTQPGVLVISGKSYPENVNDFYKPVFEYIEQYKTQPADKTILEFNWIYFNTATSKIIIKLILGMKQLKEAGHKVEIKWICKKTDELMIEKGEEIKDVIDVDFHIVLT